MHLIGIWATVSISSIIEEEFWISSNNASGLLNEEQPDALLVSGDIFDTVAPSNAIVSIYNRIVGFAVGKS